MRSPSTVMTLFKSCSPLTVFGIIPQLVVNSLYRKTVRGVSHILKEVLKLLPPLTYRDSSSSVVFVSNSFGVPTPLNHGSPNHVHRRPSHSVGVFDVNSFVTPAGFGGSSREAFSENSPFSPAVALAPVLDLVVFVVLHSFKNCNFGERPPCEVYHLHRNDYRHNPSCLSIGGAK